MRIVLAAGLLIALALLLGAPRGTVAQSDYQCSDFTKQQNAQGILDSDPDSAASLDPDGNGVACEGYAFPAATGGAKTDAERIADLEALVSKQQDEIDALTKRVDALEGRAPSTGVSNPQLASTAVNTLNGDILLFADAQSWPGDGDPGFECQGEMASEGYSDIREGLPVTVRDQDGKVVGTGTLETGKTKRDTSGATACDFPFVINNLPDRDFYTISAGRRGDITYSEGDLKSKGWRVVLSLGG